MERVSRCGLWVDRQAASSQPQAIERGGIVGLGPVAERLDEAFKKAGNSRSSDRGGLARGVSACFICSPSSCHAEQAISLAKESACPH